MTNQGPPGIDRRRCCWRLRRCARRRRPIRPGKSAWSSACRPAAAATSWRAIYADKLPKLAGKPVIVENKPGMILSIGADAVAKSPPDGYTILITSVTSSHAANLFNFKKLPYDPIKDFTPVATLQKSYFILMVREAAPWKTVAELTEAMKIKGDKASYGYGAPPALASAELYKARKGLKAIGIPYKTSMASLPEMFSGEIDFQFIDSTAGTPLLQSGKVRGLAVTSGQRVPGVDLPTMAEAADIPEFDIAPVWGVLLPGGSARADRRRGCRIRDAGGLGHGGQVDAGHALTGGDREPAHLAALQQRRCPAVELMNWKSISPLNISGSEAMKCCRGCRRLSDPCEPCRARRRPTPAARRSRSSPCRP